MPDGAAASLVGNDRFFDRLPSHVHAGLTAEQRAAIAIALRERQGAAPPVNIRLSLPFPKGRLFLTVVAGRDRRGGKRRTEERRRNPLKTLGNFLFVIAAAVMFYAVVAGILLTSPPMTP
jgi:hypothetical protein